MSCDLCKTPKTIRTCEECGKEICKQCVRYSEREAFRFLPNPSPVLQNQIFCYDCFTDKVEPEIEKYQRTLAAAKEVIYLTKNYKGIIPTLRKAKFPVQVHKHVDRRDAIMHMAFLAAHEDYNAIIQADTVQKQLRNEAYQTSEWSGSGLPVVIDIKKFERLSED